MKATADPRAPASEPAKVPKIFDSTKTIRNIRRLIWLYLWLLIFEGAFRKWIVPQYSAPLLLIRDPVVLGIYLLALRARIFPQNVYVISLVILAILSWAAGIIVLLPYLATKTIVLVTGYGVRSNFLHLPLIFIIPALFDEEDVKRVGWWTIIGMIPMALLMAMQFASAPDAYINRAAGLGDGAACHFGHLVRHLALRDPLGSVYRIRVRDKWRDLAYGTTQHTEEGSFERFTNEVPQGHVNAAKRHPLTCIAN